MSLPQLSYSLDEVAAAIGGRCTARWLADRINSDELPAIRVSRQLRMTRDDIDEAMHLLRAEQGSGLTNGSRRHIERKRRAS